MKKTNNYFWIGIILIISAVLYCLKIFNIDFKNFLVLIVCVFLMICSIKNNTVYLKYISVFFITSGLMRILSFNPIIFLNNVIVYYFTWLCVLFFGIFIVSKKKVFLLISSAFIFLITLYLINDYDLDSNINNAYTLFAFTLYFVWIFILENKKIGYIPLFISLILYLFGANNLLIGNNIISNIHFKLINLLILVISALLLMIISKFKTGREENKIE